MLTRYQARLVASVLVAVGALGGVTGFASTTPALADPAACPTADTLTTEQVDAAEEDCDLAGKWIELEGNDVLIPPEGLEVTLNYLHIAGAGSAEWTVANTGEDITYEADGDEILPDPGGISGPDTGCDRSTYDLNGKKQPGSGPGSGLYISPGDGGNPAGATDAEFRDRIVAALNELTSAAGCGYYDQIDIDYWVNPQTTYETDFTVNGDGNTVCAGYFGTDGVSTIDGGDITKPGSDPVALTCTWTATGSGNILEADVRLNTHDYNFTMTPNAASCNNSAYDLRSVLTHELGHAFGMADIGPSKSVGTTADRYLTMYESSSSASRSPVRWARATSLLCRLSTRHDDQPALSCRH